MKSIARYIIPMAGLAAFLPAVLAQDAPPPPDNKEMRVVAGPGSPDDNTPPPPRGHHFGQRGGPREMESVTFLGVETRPADATLAEQLNLPNGSGLIVRNVGPDTPAAAVLKKNDVLTKLDDQLLIEMRQLSVLIRNHKEGDEVTLTFIRGGKEITAKVKLAKHDVPKMALMDLGQRDGNMAFAFGGAEAGALPGMGRDEADRVLALIDRDDQNGPGQRVFNMQVERDDGPGMRNITVNTSNSNMVFSDEQGSLDLTIKDGKKTLVATDAKGKQLYSGPVNTPEERKALPADVRARLDKLENMQEFSFKTDGDFQPGETKDVRPLHQGTALPVPPPPPGARPPSF
jgi:hypothetical protein